MEYESISMYEHPVWQYCAIVETGNIHTSSILIVQEIPDEVLRDWENKYGKFPGIRKY